MSQSPDCHKVRDRLLEYCYDELPAELAANTRKHLVACPACRAEYEGYRQTIASLDQIEDSLPRLDLARLCMRAVNDAKRLRRRWRLVGVAACAASLILCIGVASLLDIDLQRGQLTATWRQPDRAPLHGVEPPAIGDPTELARAASTVDGSDRRSLWTDRAPFESNGVVSNGNLGYLALRDRAISQGVDSLPLPKLGAETIENISGVHLHSLDDPTRDHDI